MRLDPREQDRLASLRSYAILDTAPEWEYDAITRLGALLCDAPIALISFVDADRQWFKSAYGLRAQQTPRDIALCNDVVEADAPLVLPDATRDRRYDRNPWVTGNPGIRAYAGIPLSGRDGLPLGALCVIDRRPRRFSAQELEGLSLLAAQVVGLLELRRIDRAAGRNPVVADLRDPKRLRRALEDGEFGAEFQPIVDLRASRTVGVEALLRWQHPEYGLLPPSTFLPAIESSQLIIPVGRRMVELGVEMLAVIDATPDLPYLFGVAVNVSPAQLQQPGFAQMALSVLSLHGVSASRLSVEITETTPFGDLGCAARELAELNEAGVRLALDDYGVGFSALSRLLELPLSALKLDRSLVAGLPHDARSAAVSRSTFALAQDMGLEVVCEGIETDDQRRALLKLGARYGQGWLFGRPMDVRGLIQHLRLEISVPAERRSEHDDQHAAIEPRTREGTEAR